VLEKNNRKNEEMAPNLLNKNIVRFNSSRHKEGIMTRIDLEKRDRMAYLALYYAIHGDVKRSEKIRTSLRQMDEERELVPVAARQAAPVL